MAAKCIKSLLVAVFTTILLVSSYNAKAQHEEPKAADEHATEKKEGFNAKEVIFDHIMDAHEFHFVNYKGGDGELHHVSIPMPELL